MEDLYTQEVVDATEFLNWKVTLELRNESGNECKAGASYNDVIHIDEDEDGGSTMTKK